MLDFQIKTIQHVRFWVKSFTTRQNLVRKNKTRWIFNQKFFDMSDFEKFSAFKKTHVLVHFTPWKRHILHLSWFFKKFDFVLKIPLRGRFWIEKNTTRQILNWRKHNPSDFELKKIQHVRFWIEKNTTRQI